MSLQRRGVLCRENEYCIHIVRFLSYLKVHGPTGQGRLAEKEKEKNTTPFKDWPETPGIPYELELKRRNSGLDKRN